MKKILVMTMTFVGVCSSAFAEEVVSHQSPKSLRIGVIATWVNAEKADGAIIEGDLSPRDHVFIQLEMAGTWEMTYSSTSDYSQTETTDSSSNEVGLGYLRRVLDYRHLGFYVGPSVGFHFDSAEINGSRDYGDSGTKTYHADIDYDNGISVYANLKADYKPFKGRGIFLGIGIFAMISYGYQFERGGTVLYEFDSNPNYNFTVDSDTYWKTSIGVFYSF